MYYLFAHLLITYNANRNLPISNFKKLIQLNGFTDRSVYWTSIYGAFPRRLLVLSTK